MIIVKKAVKGQVFKSKDNSLGVRFLVSNDFELSPDDFKTIYKKRWSVEEFHKSLKQNVGIGSLLPELYKL